MLRKNRAIGAAAPASECGHGQPELFGSLIEVEPVAWVISH
jgi:hypothetical protein